MSFIRMPFALMLVAVASSTAAKAISNEKCVVQGKYNPGLTNKILADCRKVIFHDLHVASNQQLNLTNMNGLTIEFLGNITFGVRYNRIRLMHITGSNLNISASPFAWFDGKGAIYWDGGGYGQGCLKPIFSMFEVQNSTLRGLKILNSPAHAFMIGGSYGSSFIDFEVDDSLGDVNHLAVNTDGIHLLQSSNIAIIGAKIHNQDDCVCITSGCNVTISNITCIGGGLSVGSIGRNRINEVEKVIFSHSTITSSLYGILIKAWAGMKGTVQHVSFVDIVLYDVKKYGIAITQGWTNQGIESTAKNGVQFTDLILSDINGNVLEKAQNVAINCAEGGCQKFIWRNVNVLGGKGAHIENSFVPKGALYAH